MSSIDESNDAESWSIESVNAEGEDDDEEEDEEEEGVVKLRGDGSSGGPVLDCGMVAILRCCLARSSRRW